MGGRTHLHRAPAPSLSSILHPPSSEQRWSCLLPALAPLLALQLCPIPPGTSADLVDWERGDGVLAGSACLLGCHSRVVSFTHSANIP